MQPRTLLGYHPGGHNTGSTSNLPNGVPAQRQQHRVTQSKTCSMGQGFCSLLYEHGTASQHIKYYR